MKEIGLSDGISLGCGNPTMLAQLEPGQVVVELVSRAGLDMLLSARRISPAGHANGVDMTDEMLEVATRNAQKSGVTNATFLTGTIENVPLPDASVDVLISKLRDQPRRGQGGCDQGSFPGAAPGWPVR